MSCQETHRNDAAAVLSGFLILKNKAKFMLQLNDNEIHSMFCAKKL